VKTQHDIVRQFDGTRGLDTVEHDLKDVALLFVGQAYSSPVLGRDFYLVQ